MNEIIKIGFGGSCHWCTEAIFQSLIGVQEVKQGWIASKEDTAYSEAVIVVFDQKFIDTQILVEIHLRTHSSTSEHSMRKKYRSAVYVFSKEQFQLCKNIMATLQKQFAKPLITQVQYFESFKLNTSTYLDYYYKNPEKPFCKNFIDPKLVKLRAQFGKYVSMD